MKKYKYFILAVSIAIVLTFVQLTLSKASVKGESSNIYVALRDIKRGESIAYEDFEERIVYGYSCSFDFDDKLKSIQDIVKGSVLNNHMFEEDILDENYILISLNADKSRCAFSLLSLKDKVDLFLIPDTKKLDLVESAWLDSALKEISVEYNTDRDVGFTLRDIVIVALPEKEGAGQTFCIAAEKSIARILAVLKERCIIEVLVPNNF